MERIIRAAGALGITVPRYTGRRLRYILVWLFVVATCITPAGASLAATSLTNASVALSDPRPSPATSSYTFTGSSVDTGTVIKCVKVVWSTTASGDTAPTGFSAASGSVTAASSTLINSSATGWSLANQDVVVCFVYAVAHCRITAIAIRAQPQIDDASDGVRPILSRRTVS